MHRSVHALLDLERHVAYARRGVAPCWHALITQGVIGAVHGGERIVLIVVRACEKPKQYWRAFAGLQEKTKLK